MYEQTELYVADVTWVVGRGMSLGMLRDTYSLCPARELVADRDKPAAGSVRAREISPALRALLMAKKPQCPSVFRLCEYSSLHVLLSDCCF